MNYDVVILGGGHSGGQLGIFLRKLKFEGSILIISEEKYSPYQRPALSKGIIKDEVKIESLLLKKDDFYKKNNVELKNNIKIDSIDLSKKTLISENGRILINYKKLILATGAKPKKINTLVPDSEIHYLRSIDDSIKLKPQLNKNKELIIIGAGYIGLEVASVAVKKNKSVTIIESDKKVLSRVTSKDIADFFEYKHKKEGVKFSLNNAVDDISITKEKKKVRLDNGQELFGDEVIVSIGVDPAIDIAREAGLDCENGILVDENCITSNKDIFAIGDCANHYNKIYKRRVRLESVHNAVEQALSVAQYLIGNPKPYHQVPWFWSDQYNIKLQMAGLNEGYEEAIIRGSEENESFSVFYVRSDKIIAVDCVNKPKDFVIGKKLIEQKAVIPEQLIIDEKSDLRELMKH